MKTNTKRGKPEEATSVGGRKRIKTEEVPKPNQQQNQDTAYTPCDFYINGSVIQEVTYFNDLGVIISNDLKWDRHWNRFKSRVLHLKMLLNVNFNHKPSNLILDRTYRMIVIPKLIFGSSNAFMMPGERLVSAVKGYQGITAWNMRESLFKRWFSYDRLCTNIAGGYYTNYDLNAHCIIDWIRVILRYKFGGAQLKHSDLWRVGRRGNLTNTQKHYSLGSFNHSAYRIWNRLPPKIKNEMAENHPTIKAKCKRVMTLMKSELSELFNIKTIKNVKEKSQALRKLNQKKTAEARRTLFEYWNSQPGALSQHNFKY